MSYPVCRKTGSTTRQSNDMSTCPPTTHEYIDSDDEDDKITKRNIVRPYLEYMRGMYTHQTQKQTLFEQSFHECNKNDIWTKSVFYLWSDDPIQPNHMTTTTTTTTTNPATTTDTHIESTPQQNLPRQWNLTNNTNLRL